MRGWMLYDFANSAFSTTVVTIVPGPYLTGLIESQVGKRGTFTLLGVPIAAESFFTYCVSLSVFLQVFILPVLGAIADYSNLKRRLMLFFAVLGSVCTIGLFFITGLWYVLGGLDLHSGERGLWRVDRVLQCVSAGDCLGRPTR